MGRKKENKFKATITLGPVGETLLIRHEAPGRGTAITAALMLFDQADAGTREALVQAARADAVEPNKVLLPVFAEMLKIADGELVEQFRTKLEAARGEIAEEKKEIAAATLRAAQARARKQKRATRQPGQATA